MDEYRLTERVIIKEENGVKKKLKRRNSKKCGLERRQVRVIMKQEAADGGFSTFFYLVNNYYVPVNY